VTQEERGKKQGAKTSEESREFGSAGDSYMKEAEQKLKAREYREVGALYFKAVAAHLQAACERRGIDFAGKDQYFVAIEELTSQTGAEWAERALCELVVLHHNDERGYLTHGQVRRFAQDGRRLVRWMKSL
jgi:hypothetical protein